MKRFVLMVCALGSFVCTFAQNGNVTYQTLLITTNKTTSLLFASMVQRGDIGSPDVLAEPVDGNRNILLIKARQSDFAETNLNVITADGRFYSFTIRYDSLPPQQVYIIPPTTALNEQKVIQSSNINNNETVKIYARDLLDNPRQIHGIKDRKWHVMIKVNGIYVKDNVMFYQLLLQNRSPIDYNINMIRFFIRDRKQSKRTASQEKELIPRYICGNTQNIKAHQRSVIVVALDKFTIPDAQYLGIQIMEHHGGRHLLIRVSNDKLMKAIPLPDLR